MSRVSLLNTSSYYWTQFRYVKLINNPLLIDDHHSVERIIRVGDLMQNRVTGLLQSPDIQIQYANIKK